MSTQPEKKSRFSRKPKDPDNPGRVSQFKTLYQASVKQNPKIPLWMALTFVITLVVFMFLLHFIWSSWIYTAILGAIFGLLAAVIVFGRLAERAAYGSLEGRAGGTGAALQSLKRGWTYEQEPVAAEAGRARRMSELSNAAMVFRAVGKPGVVLIGEGPTGSSRKLLESERKRVSRVAGREVPVHILRVGEGDDTVKLSDLAKTMKKLPKTLTDAEAKAVTKRLRALGAAKPPIPKGMDPRNAPRMDRKAMRGR
ncbi:membrane protein [Flexivirga endophytica]|uniref:Membrane protein n=1 Tax=Flexivirga endophytica TaxID=1849103 RepID=A0A916SV55_9MICO|nr:DUF4191 domain-containing protein [Flexivirga endophytica]GGB19143.1 membrane protein [Flexivirga endophytica]GHB36505.1 membrane protein [Flexivirga endophytica]